MKRFGDFVFIGDGELKKSSKLPDELTHEGDTKKYEHAGISDRIPWHADQAERHLQESKRFVATPAEQKRGDDHRHNARHHALMALSLSHTGHMGSHAAIRAADVLRSMGHPVPDEHMVTGGGKSFLKKEMKKSDAASSLAKAKDKLKSFAQRKEMEKNDPAVSGTTVSDPNKGGEQGNRMKPNDKGLMPQDSVKNEDWLKSPHAPTQGEGNSKEPDTKALSGTAGQAASFKKSDRGPGSLQWTEADIARGLAARDGSMNTMAPNLGAEPLVKRERPSQRRGAADMPLHRAIEALDDGREY